VIIHLFLLLKFLHSQWFEFELRFVNVSVASVHAFVASEHAFVASGKDFYTCIKYVCIASGHITNACTNNKKSMPLLHSSCMISTR
jgi:hypothetical protein